MAKKNSRSTARLPHDDLYKTTAEHVRSALEKLRAGASHKFGPSTDYDVVTDTGERLPPKAVFGLAASEALGFEVLPEHFSGGAGTPCFRVLEAAGLTILPKDELASSGNWWVNQNQTYKHEVHGGFLWSPKANKNGGKNQFYDNMTLVKPGDLIFSFCDTFIKAVGVALGPAQTTDKPDFGGAGENWERKGWLVPVEFSEIDTPVRPKDFIEELRPHIADKYAPLQSNGNGNQSVYLASISDGFANVLLTKIGKPAPTRADALTVEERKDEEVQDAIQGRTDIGPTQKQQLVQARRGQGIFRSNVRLNEKKCRITGVQDVRLLIASHIKPWADSSDKEKLDGRNGLLLSPHVDRLFDKGLISFQNDGTMLVSSKLDRAVFSHWKIDEKKNVGAFKPEQCAYLEYHRSNRFKK